MAKRSTSNQHNNAMRVGKHSAAFGAATLANLQKIDHFVVLMMENRSFDHLLGYLQLDAVVNVNGLTLAMQNSFNGTVYTPQRMASSTFTGHDPCHKGVCVAEQLTGTNSGFVRNYATEYPQACDWRIPMTFYDATSVPVYDFLARNFCVCDAWFSSVPGATWPNRLYSLAGEADGSKDNKLIPIYDKVSVMRHLDASSIPWRWYSYDVSTLRLIDKKYRVGHHNRFFHVEHPVQRNLIADALSGDLPSIAWIDPNFSDWGWHGNDDHPPTDLVHGQDLVLKIVYALMTGPLWQRTMLVIVYDEHGGFFDHEPPPTVPDDSPAFRQLGVRVPAIVVSPWVPPGIANSTIFDHTSLIKTALMRFCLGPAGQIPDMGRRTNEAEHLGNLLTLSTPTAAIDLRTISKKIASLKQETSEMRFDLTSNSRLKGYGTRNDLQANMALAREKLYELGLPRGSL